MNPQPQKSLVLPVTLAVVITAVLVGSGTYYFSLNQPSNQPQTLITAVPTQVAVTSPTPLATPSASPTPLAASFAPDIVDTTTWKTYTNTKYKYSIKYPTNWSISAKAGTNPATNASPVFQLKCNVDAGDRCASMGVEIADLGDKDVDAFKPIEDSNQKILASSPSKGGILIVDFAVNANDPQLKHVYRQYIVPAKPNVIKFTFDESSKNKNEINSTADWKYADIFGTMITTLVLTDFSSSDPH